MKTYSIAKGQVLIPAILRRIYGIKELNVTIEDSKDGTKWRYS